MIIRSFVAFQHTAEKMMTVSSAPNARTSFNRVYTLKPTTITIKADRLTQMPMMRGYCDWALTSGGALITHPEDDILTCTCMTDGARQNARVEKRDHRGTKAVFIPHKVCRLWMVAQLPCNHGGCPDAIFVLPSLAAIGCAGTC